MEVVCLTALPKDHHKMGPFVTMQVLQLQALLLAMVPEVGVVVMGHP